MDSKDWCALCLSQFNNSKQLEFHMAWRHGEQPHHCKICKSNFSSLSRFIQHQKVHKTRHVCPSCNKEFSLEACLRLHLLGHFEETGRAHSCGICGMRFRLKSSLLCHRRKIHLRKTCSKTSQNFPDCSKKSLRDQIGEVLFCPICDKQFTSKTHLSEHSLSHASLDGLDRVKSFDKLDKVVINESLSCSPSRTNKTRDRLRRRCTKKVSPKIESNASKGNHHPIIEDLVIHKAPSKKQNKKAKSSQKLIKPKTEEYEYSEVPSSVKQDYMTHMEERQRMLKCQVCEDLFFDLETLHGHLTLTHGWLPCHHCDQTFSTRKELRLHSRLKHDLEGYHCQVCPKTFRTSSQLKMHRLVHTGEKPYKCSDCDASFRQHNHLRRHKLHHSGEKPYKCDVCNRQFAGTQALVHHKVTKHRELQPEELLNKSVSFQCDRCPRQCASKSSLEEHLRTHTGERPYKCSFCPSTFRQHAAKYIHEKSHKSEKDFLCSYCSKTFSLSQSLAAHERTHTGERPFKCPQCPKAFKQHSTMKSHIKIHSGERLYQCSFCPSTFLHNSSLRLHTRTHTGEKPYVCVCCAAAFSSSRSLKQHMNIHETPLDNNLVLFDENVVS